MKYSWKETYHKFKLKVIKIIAVVPAFALLIASISMLFTVRSFNVSEKKLQQTAVAMELSTISNMISDDDLFKSGIELLPEFQRKISDPQSLLNKELLYMTFEKINSKKNLENITIQGFSTKCVIGQQHFILNNVNCDRITINDSFIHSLEFLRNKWNDCTIKSTTLDQCQFSSGMWSTIHLDSTKLYRVSFVGTRLTNWIVNNSDIQEVKAYNLELQDGEIHHCQFDNCLFINSSIKISFINCIFNNVTFDKCNMTNVISLFQNCKFFETTFINCNLHGSEIFDNNFLIQPKDSLSIRISQKYVSK